MSFARLSLLSLGVAVVACEPTPSTPPASEQCPPEQVDMDMSKKTCVSEPGRAAPTPAPAPVTGPPRLIVHEWGTFTAVAAADGQAMSWRPLTGPSDLPAFVYSEPHTGQLAGHG